MPCANFSAKYSFRTVPVLLGNGSSKVKVSALLDDGSSKSYMNANIAAKLGVQGHVETMNVGVINGGTQMIDSMSVDVKLKSVDGKVDRYVMLKTADNVTGDIDVVDWKREAGRWPHLKDIRFPDIVHGQGVDLLIGLDHADLHFSCCDIRGKWGEPSARLTPLGWTCVSASIDNNNY